jgi:hypothetical protein
METLVALEASLKVQERFVEMLGMFKSIEYASR